MKKLWQNYEWKEKQLQRLRSPETREKNRVSHLGQNLGEKNYLYRDGRGNEPYGVEFTDALKLKIRKRDDFMCQWPGCGLPENGKAFPIHHIDHNRHNNNELNLITLCNNHHLKEKFMNLDEAMIMFEDVFRARLIRR